MPPTTVTQTSTPRRPLLLAAGWLCFGLGAVGIVLPGLPTTIFWILAAWLWMRSDPARLRWLLSHPRYGATIRRFLERGEISRHDKLAALLGIAAAFAITWLVLQPSLVAGGGFGLLMTAVGAWIWWRPEPAPEAAGDLPGA